MPFKNRIPLLSNVVFQMSDRKSATLDITIAFLVWSGRYDERSIKNMQLFPLPTIFPAVTMNEWKDCGVKQ